jgi:transcriptional regulator with XRE-family HTH domain
MLGKLIAYILKEKNIPKTQISNDTSLDVGHLTHIVKGERMPSHKVLDKICESIDVPYQQLMYTYDKELTDEQIKNNMLKHISYNTVPAIDNIDMLVACPYKFGRASIAVKIPDSTMEPKLLKDSYAYVEFNSPLDNGDIGLFFINGKTIIRKFAVKGDFYVLKAISKGIEDIKLPSDSNFYILGKVIGTTDM